MILLTGRVPVFFPSLALARFAGLHYVRRNRHGGQKLITAIARAGQDQNHGRTIGWSYRLNILLRADRGRGHSPAEAASAGAGAAATHLRRESLRCSRHSLRAAVVGVPTAVTTPSARDSCRTPHASASPSIVTHY